MHRPRLKMVGRGSGRHRLASNAVPGFCVWREEGALFLSVVTSASGVDTSFFSHGPMMFAASRLVFRQGYVSVNLSERLPLSHYFQTGTETE